ncbi:hypothetical protein ES332_A06G210700v1 [Gossypium tomentosum]|uniref:Uncharacterized protein n=1 Tax=Gossypium tomentosum TaxID=34277 RepID=A0A5D2Q6V9_GOSTO|nr:hypothetical protein ES332_A06G210700v1 [Gossypium tomentosum]
MVSSFLALSHSPLARSPDHHRPPRTVAEKTKKVTVQLGGRWGGTEAASEVSKGKCGWWQKIS